MGQGRFGHDRILSGVIVCHVVGNNGVFPERGSRGPCVGFWVPGSIWQRMWYFCAKFLWIKGVFYHGLCVIIYAGRIVPCLHWYLIRVIGRMTSWEWFSIWETSNNIINFNDVRKRLWKLVSMMMFSPCVFCVLPCVTSTFTVSKLARIIKQASRVGGCERVFTPVRWRQVRLSCIKWRSTFFFYIFSCVHRSVGSSSSGWTAAAPTVLLGWRFCPADTPRENNVIMTLSPRRVPVGLASEAGRSPWCREFVGVTASSVWGRCWWAPGWGNCRRRSWSARFPRFTRCMTSQ